MGEASSVTTRDLWARLMEAPTIDAFLEGADEGSSLPAFSEYITALCEARGEKPERVINRCGIDRSFGHRLFSGARKPSRDTILMLAFGFELSVDGTQQLLKVGRASALHPKVKRDAVIAFCLHNGLPLMEAQQSLYDCGLPLLGSRAGDNG